jgi:hypothetical protein
MLKVPREIAMAADRHHAHRLLDQLGPGQLDAVVHLLETMIAPDEDGSTPSNAERNAIAEADEWLRHNQPSAHEEVLAEFGLTIADWEKMGHESPPGETPRRDG